MLYWETDSRSRSRQRTRRNLGIGRCRKVSERFEVALGQVRPVLGDVAKNVEKHLLWIDEARRAGTSLIVFPELGLTGYQVQDLTLDVARPMTHPDIMRLVEATRGISAVFSFVEESPEHMFYITAVYASDGGIVGRHRKVYLPTYGMFDEGRYFAPGDGFHTFDTDHGSVGMMVCEDAWHMSSPYLLALGGARLLIVPASSPARSVTDPESFGSQRFWREIVQVYAQLLGINIIFVNRVGFEDGVNFFGGSGVVTATGDWVVQAPILEESLSFGTVDMSVVRRARYSSPVLRDEKRHLVQRELVRIARDAKERKPL